MIYDLYLTKVTICGRINFQYFDYYHWSRKECVASSVPGGVWMWKTGSLSNSFVVLLTLVLGGLSVGMTAYLKYLAFQKRRKEKVGTYRTDDEL